MTGLNLIGIPLVAKICLVCLFPISALDKMVHWHDAIKQASSGPLPSPAVLVVVGVFVEAVTPVMIVLGWFDRAAAFVLAGFCVVTALFYHRWWKYPDFWSENGKGRAHLWDFLKNLGLVGGLLLVVIAGS